MMKKKIRVVLTIQMEKKCDDEEENRGFLAHRQGSDDDEEDLSFLAQEKMPTMKKREAFLCSWAGE